MRGEGGLLSVLFSMKGLKKGVGVEGRVELGSALSPLHLDTEQGKLVLLKLLIEYLGNLCCVGHFIHFVLEICLGSI